MKRQPFGTRDFGGGTWDKSKDPTTNSDNSNWKPVLVMKSGERGKNGLVFTTYREALESAKDTFYKWTVPVSFEAEATDEPVKHLYNFDEHKVEDVSPVNDSSYVIQVNTGINASTSEEPLG